MASAKPQTRRSPGRGFRRVVLVAVLVVLMGVILVHGELSADRNKPPAPPTSAARPYGSADASPGPGLLDVQPAVRPDNPFSTAPPQATPPQATPLQAAGPQEPVLPLPPAPPTRVVIPKIEVDAPVVGLGIEPSGELAVPDPDDRNLAGWFEDGAAPGSTGAAVVVAHVDTHTGPAAFYRLGTLRPGDTADIVRADGTIATFRIESVEVFDKKAFPTARVYAGTPNAQLRLITCGGTYIKGAGGYQSNVVAFATLVSARRG